jgi:hypothetical protein
MHTCNSPTKLIQPIIAASTMSPYIGPHYSTSSASSSQASLVFDYERQLPKPMCGTTTLTKLGILPSQIERRQKKYIRKGKATYKQVPIELTPINNLFVTEQEFMQGFRESETESDGRNPLSCADSVDFSAVSIPQFDINTAMNHESPKVMADESERPDSSTPKG